MLKIPIRLFSITAVDALSKDNISCLEKLLATGLCFSALIHAKIRLQNVRYKKEKKQLFNKVGYTWTSSKETEMKSDGPESCVRLKLPLGPFKKNSSYYIYYI